MLHKGKTENIFKYVGKYGVQTDSNNLVYMRNRYYNLDMKRFLNMDHIKDGINWFSYVEGNPIQFIDPLGLYKNNHPYPQYGQYQHPMSPDDIKKYKQGLADRDEKEAKQKILDGNSDTLRRSTNMYFESNKKVPDTPSKSVKPKAFWWEGRHDKNVDIKDKCVKIDEDDEGNRDTSPKPFAGLRLQQKKDLINQLDY